MAADGDAPLEFWLSQCYLTPSFPLKELGQTFAATVVIAWTRLHDFVGVPSLSERHLWEDFARDQLRAGALVLATAPGVEI